MEAIFDVVAQEPGCAVAGIMIVFAVSLLFAEKTFNAEAPDN